MSPDSEKVPDFEKIRRNFAKPMVTRCMSGAMDGNSREVFDREALVHARALFAFGKRLCKNDHDAEDLLQDTFMQALRKFHQYQPGTNCKSWLFRIMHNAFRSRFRKKANTTPTVDIHEEDELYLHKQMLDENPSYQDNPERVFFAKVPSAELQKGLDALPEDYRSVLLLCDVEGLSYQEISEVLEIPVGTVRSRLSRARTRLQKSLLRSYRERL